MSAEVIENLRAQIAELYLLRDIDAQTLTVLVTIVEALAHQVKRLEQERQERQERPADDMPVPTFEEFVARAGAVTGSDRFHLRGLYRGLYGDETEEAQE